MTVGKTPPGVPQRRKSPVVVLVVGPLDAWTASRVNDEVDDALATCPRELVIDLSACPSIDAAGILLLMDAQRRALRIGGCVTVRSPGPQVRRHLQWAHVSRVIPIAGPFAVADQAGPAADAAR